MAEGNEKGDGEDVVKPGSPSARPPTGGAEERGVPPSG